MNTETITVRNRDGTSFAVTFDESQVIEQKQGIGIRLPVEIWSDTKPRLRRALLISAIRQSYLTRNRFLDRIESVGKSQIIDWIENSNDGGMIMPKPTMADQWTIDWLSESGDEATT